MKKVVTIAGSDSSGGAGIQADLKTFSAHGVYGMSIVTAVTAQNTQGILAIEDISQELISKQIDAIFTDIKVDAVKIGMVSNVKSILAIEETLIKYKPKYIVLDPVMISTSGFPLLKVDSKKALINKLFPLSYIVTPNIPEAEEIIYENTKKELNIKTIKDMEKAALKIYELGPKNVLIKGGHLEGNAIDLLYNGKVFTYYESERIVTKNTHGTGCSLSSSIASNLALEYSLIESMKKSKDYITNAIKHSINIGKGKGPIHHFYELYKKSGK